MLNGEDFAYALASHVRISAIQSSKQSNTMTPKELSRRWNIGLDKAKKTLNITMQRGTHTVAYPSLDAHFWTNNRASIPPLENLYLHQHHVFFDHVNQGQRLHPSFC
jgi:hypothetical protein